MQLQLPDLSGLPYAFRLKGQPIVVNFWATWCAPCVREMPELDALQKKYPQVRFVGIGVDSAANMQKFVEKVQVSYPLWVIGAGAIDTLRKLGNPSGGLPLLLFSTQMAALTGRYWVKSNPMTWTALYLV